MHQSIQLPEPCELINITQINPLISKCQIKVCYVGDQPNRNNSVITKEVATELAKSLPGSPIVGYYNRETGDFEEHNRIIDISNGEFRIEDTTKPYGFVDLNAKVWFQKFLDDGQFEREYLVTEGYLWTKAYPECQRVLEKGNNHSMELDEDSLKGTWAENENGNTSFFIINEALVEKLCILGELVEPCFEGSQITRIKFSFDEGFKNQFFSLMNDMKEFLNKGGNQMDNENLEVAQAAENAEFAANDNDKKDVCPECGKPLDECECNKQTENACGDDKKKKKYNLEEVEEYISLKAEFDELQDKFSALQNDFDNLKVDNEALVNFKLEVEKKEKEAMINSFYMLSDEDKKDVVEHINEYSLNDIEAKLSVICVRNKVSFNLDDDNKTAELEDPTTYSLNAESMRDEPAWITALRN